MKNHSLLFFTLFICALIAGYSFSARFYPSDFNLLNASLKVVFAHEQKPIAVLNTGQRSILLVTTSSLSTLDSHLESVWLATYLPSGSDIRLLSIYPTGDQPISDFEAQLVNSFGLNKKNGQLVLDEEFQEILVGENYWWSGYLVLDEVAMADIFDLLGGLQLKGQTLSGEQVISELPDVTEEPGNAYSFQIAMLQSACKQFTRVASNAVLSQVRPLLSHHIITDLQSDQLETEIQSQLAGEHQPACKFPMLEKSQIVH
jgi:hypothetical protein